MRRARIGKAQQAAINSSRAKKRNPKGGAKTNLPTIGGPNCWCGQPSGHDWPGRNKGKVHPR